MEKEEAGVVEGAPAEETKTLSKAQKKKLKDKLKKEQEAKEAAEREAKGEVPAEKPAAADAGGKKKKGKPVNAAAAAALEKKRLIEEAMAEQRKIEEEEKAAEEAERKAQEEAEAALKAVSQAKKDAKQAKIDKMKAEGTYLSKKELQKKREADAKRAQLIAQGILKEGEEEEKPKSSMVKAKKGGKKDKKQQEEQNMEKQESAAAADEEKQIDTKVVKKEEAKPKVAEVEEEKKEESDDLVDDWENADVDEIVGKIKVDKDQAAKMIADDEEDKEEKLQQQVKKDTEPAAQQSKKKGKKAEKQEKTEAAPADLFGGQSEDQKAARERRKAENMKRLAEMKAKRAASKEAKFRCPIVCILGHVDTGKTLILDKLRKTNVQAGEAGGITQQIGATYFPRAYIEGHNEKVKGRLDIDLKLPGFLVIDTPGHESFTNLRSRGSSLCDIAILVVDLMHGLEPQTKESIELLRQKKCPFIVALNKIDRCYEWKSTEYQNCRDSLEQQLGHTLSHFEDRKSKAIVDFAEEGFNACLYWENLDVNEYLSLCPTSAITGEGLPDLMTYLALQCQERIPKQLYEKDDFECTVLEVKVIDGLGTTIDVVLLNGLLKVQDTICLAGLNGPIVTQVRALLTPQPLKELRVKAEYQSHQKIRGAMGIKISAPGLEYAIAGSELFKANNEEEIAQYKAEIEDGLVDILEKYVDKSQDGVCVQASTLGSLEALLEFLKDMKIPVTNISIGPVHKKDVLKAMKVLAQDPKKIKKEYATILAFDVKVTPDAAKFAEEEGITIFTANIIYHLFDEFTAHVKACQDSRKSDGGSAAIFPCALEIVKDAVFNRSNPIILGVNVTAGQLRVGTPLCIPEKENVKIGVVESIQLNKTNVQKATAKDGSVAVRIGGQSSVSFGRTFDESNQICSWITRKSIDALKEYFRDEVTQEEWKLAKILKTKYKIE